MEYVLHSYAAFALVKPLAETSLAMIDTIAEAGVSPLPAPTPATGKISSSVTTGRNDAVTVAAVDSSSAGMKPTLTVPSSSSSHTSKATNQKRSTKKKGGRTAGSSASASAAAASPEKKLTHLVIDSGAIIKGAGMTLASAAEVCFVTGLLSVLLCATYLFTTDCNIPVRFVFGVYYLECSFFGGGGGF